MRRFIYAPEVTAYIRAEDADTVIDVSKDIISGSVTRRLDAVSNATLVLQNKFGLYTRKFKPMDRIAIFMTRIGDPMLVFTGYVDEAPFYQMFPAPVTIQASCTIKLLQNTYFDPGLPFMNQWFTKYGWNYDPTSGQLTDPFLNKGFGNYDQDHNIARLIGRALHDIAGWPLDHIFIRSIPTEFKTTLHKLMKAEALEYKKAYAEAVEQMARMLGVGNSGARNGGGSGGDTTTTPGGNVSGIQLATVAHAAGFRGEQLVEAVAVALAESSGKSNAMNYNTDGTYDTGCWQINTVHTAGGKPNGGLPPPPGAVGTLDMPKDWNKTKGKFTGATLSTVKNYIEDCFDPQFNANQAYGISSSGRNFSPWATYPSLAAKKLGEARTAVNEFQRGRRSGGGTGGTGGTRGGGQNPDDPNPPTHEGGGNTQWQDQGGGGNQHHQKPYVLPTTGPMGRTDEGVDWGTTPGSSVVAIGKCVVVFVGRYDGFGPYVAYKLKEGPARGSYIYSAEHATTTVSVGDHLDRGQEIGKAASSIELGFAQRSGTYLPEANPTYNKGDVTAPGVRFKRLITGQDIGENDGSSGGTGDPNTQQGGEVSDPGSLARTAAWFTLQLPTSDVIEATSLHGKRALANDIPIFEWISQMCKAGGRRFCSMPNGDFLAFFPDYFNDFNRTPYFIIRPIEILDLEIQISDRELVTHVFASGSQFEPHAVGVLDEMVSMVASIQEPAFNMFINVDDGMMDGKKSKGKKKSKKKTSDPLRIWKGSEAFLNHYGARPFKLDLPDIRHPVLIWMAAWLEFQTHWAKQFGATAQFTFMPEILPGGIINLDHKITMFVESVTHTFDMESGFTTSADLTSPAAANKKDKRFGSMVLAGGNFGVAEQLAEDKTIAKDAGPGPEDEEKTKENRKLGAD